MPRKSETFEKTGGGTLKGKGVPSANRKKSLRNPGTISTEKDELNSTDLGRSCEFSPPGEGGKADLEGPSEKTISRKSRKRGV